MSGANGAGVALGGGHDFDQGYVAGVSIFCDSCYRDTG